MSSFVKFIIGDNVETGHDWLDYANFLVTGLGLVFAYRIANRTFKKELNARKIEQDELQENDVKLFESTLAKYYNSVAKQIEALDRYIANRNFRIELVPALDTAILNFVQVRNLFLKIGFDNPEKIEELNNLLISLSSLKHFNSKLSDEIRTFIEKYAYHEKKWYLYRQLLYSKYYELQHARLVDIRTSPDGGQQLAFRHDDQFINGYNQLVRQITHDEEVILNGEMKSRSLFIERFILPLISLSAQFVPEQLEAIQINDIGNVVLAAYKNIDYIEQVHYKAVDTYKELLVKVSEQISNYLDAKILTEFAEI